VPRHLRHALVAGTALALACHAPKPPPSPAPRVAEAPPELALIPQPVTISARCAEPITIDRRTTIKGPPDVAGALAAWLGLPENAVAANGDIELAYDEKSGGRHDAAEGPVGIDEERYVVELIPPRHVRVVARGRSGLVYGAQAIAQLAGARRIHMATPPLGAADRWTLPCARIEDEPRHAFRAMHLDVARHFFDRNVVLRYVDLLAFYRFNVFHWHLTDDQGFRLRLASHPELASADGAYTAEDVKAVVAYAAARGVTVIPEIEMPGHTRAVLATHPELSCTGVKQPTPRTWGIFDDVLCAGNEGSYTLVREVLTEVTGVFPSRYVHVGGDEVPDARWNACPKCRAAMAAAHVDAVGLEHVFMDRVFDMLGEMKRQPIVWDEALPPKPGKNPPIVVAWQSSERGRLAAERGFDTVFAPYEYVYFNFKQSKVQGIEIGADGHLPWTKPHAFDIGTGPHITGGEGALWTEYVLKPEQIDPLVMPRAAALAEALWSGPRPDHEFVTRFKLQRPMLDASGVGYFIDPPAGARARAVVIDEVHVALQPPPLFPDGVIRYTRDGSVPTASSPRYRDPLSITETMTLTTALFLPSGRVSSPMRASFVKETPRPALEASLAEKRVTLAYYEGPFHKLADIAKAAPIAKTDADAITLVAAASALGSRLKADHFALVFEASIRIGDTGVQRFEIAGDDGLRVEIDGENVVEIDEEKGAREADGEIALAAGLHPIRVTYFQGTEGKQLEIKVVDAKGQRTTLDVVR